jgi:hypothetical protein
MEIGKIASFAVIFYVITNSERLMPKVESFGESEARMNFTRQTTTWTKYLFLGLLLTTL